MLNALSVETRAAASIMDNLPAKVSPFHGVYFPRENVENYPCNCVIRWNFVSTLICSDVFVYCVEISLMPRQTLTKSLILTGM